MNFLIKLSISLLLLSCLAPIDCHSQDKDDEEHPSDLLEPAFLNAKSLVRGDVLIKISTTSDATKESDDGELSGAVKDDVEFVRFVFDYETGECHCFRNDNRMLTVFADGSAAENSQKNWTAAITDPKAKKLLYRDGLEIRTESVPLSELSNPRCVEAAYLMDPRCPWSGSLRFNALRESGEGLSMFKALPKDKCSVSEVGNYLRLEFVTRITEEDNGFMRFKVNPDSLMPSSSETVVILDKIEYPIEEWKIKWGQVDGLHVPIKFTRTEGGEIVPAQNQDMDPIVGEILTSVEFCWLSINEPVDMRPFNKEKLNARAVSELTNPKLFQSNQRISFE